MNLFSFVLCSFVCNTHTNTHIHIYIHLTHTYTHTHNNQKKEDSNNSPTAVTKKLYTVFSCTSDIRAAENFGTEMIQFENVQQNVTNQILKCMTVICFFLSQRVACNKEKNKTKHPKVLIYHG